MYCRILPKYFCSSKVVVKIKIIFVNLRKLGATEVNAFYVIYKFLLNRTLFKIFEKEQKNGKLLITESIFKHKIRRSEITSSSRKTHFLQNMVYFRTVSLLLNINSSILITIFINGVLFSCIYCLR